MNDQPDILIIMSDQHNKAIMGCAGDPWVRTPALDRLAAQGVRFDSFYTNAPLCVPARMSFLTGRLPSGNLVWNNRNILNSGIPTCAHALGRAGYETALIGRMHFQGPDQYHGFQRRPYGEPFAIHPGAGPPVPELYREGVPPHSGQNRAVMEHTGRGKGAYEVADEDVTAAACGYLQEQASRSERPPFAAVVGYLLPHCPFIGDPEAFDYYYEHLPVPAVTPEYLRGLPESVRRYLQVRGLDEPLPPQRVRSARAAYYAMVERMDRLIGRVLETLEATGLDRRTLVIYTSDHGEMANSHGCWTKSCFYEGSVGLPFIARLPERSGAASTGEPLPGIPAGGLVCSPAGLADLAVTLTDLAGAPALPHAVGRSFLTALSNSGSDDEEAAVISELFDPADRRAAHMIRRGPWKLWEYHGDRRPVLFNLEEDPTEELDLGRAPSRATATQRDLLALLRESSDLEFIQRNAPAQVEDYRYLEEWGRLYGPRLPERTAVDKSRESFTGV